MGCNSGVFDGMVGVVVLIFDCIGYLVGVLSVGMFVLWFGDDWMLMVVELL